MEENKFLKQAKEIAKKLLELKIPIAQIITATGLSKKEMNYLIPIII